MGRSRVANARPRGAGVWGFARAKANADMAASLPQRAACAHCAAPAAPSQCGGCHAVAFCGAGCQRAAWPAHKPLCKAVAVALTGVRQTHCSACAIALTAEQIGLQECTRCSFASYCGAACHAAHWPTHKVVCKAIGAAMLARQIAIASKGNTIAMRNVAILHERGTGTVKDARAAFEWYRRAAEAGDTHSQALLAHCFSDGSGVTADERTAFVWYHRAAEAGDAVAQYHLGLCYSNGKGVKVNECAAVAWYRRAAVQGDAGAQYNLGVSYANGSGVAADARAAAEWLERAAASSDAAVAGEARDVLAPLRARDPP
jgi:TPR repeat protein